MPLKGAAIQLGGPCLHAAAISQIALPTPIAGRGTLAPAVESSIIRGQQSALSYWGGNTEVTCRPHAAYMWPLQKGRPRLPSDS